MSRWFGSLPALSLVGLCLARVGCCESRKPSCARDSVARGHRSPTVAFWFWLGNRAPARNHYGGNNLSDTYEAYLRATL
jgi:hypothetical protein